MNASGAVRDPLGRDAAAPWSIPLPGWKQVLVRTWNETGTDNIGLISAGVAFYAFLAIVPILGGIVMSFGLVATPETVMKTVVALTRVIPREAADLIGDLLRTVIAASEGKKGLGLLLALLVSLYGAMNGSYAIVTALNIAYEEKEKRSFLVQLRLWLLIAIGGFLLIVMSTTTVTVMAYLGSLLPTLPDVLLALGTLLTYAAMAVVGAIGAAILYRFGPSRRQARWVWLAPGSLTTSILWLVVSALFGLYVANFDSYDVTYGSLGAVVVLLTWLYLSAYVMLVGAELNAELERQTACDTTRGPARPIGARGAAMADTVVASATIPRDPAPMATSTPGFVAKTFDAPIARTAARPLGPFKEFAVARASARLAHTGSGRRAPKLTLLPSVLTTAGLMMLRARGRARLGVILLASGSGLAWLGRERSSAAPLRGNPSAPRST